MGTKSIYGAHFQLLTWLEIDYIDRNSDYLAGILTDWRSKNVAFPARTGARQSPMTYFVRPRPSTS